MRLIVSLIQMEVTQDKNENLETAKRMIEKAIKDNPKLVVLPEMFNVPYDNKFFPSFAETYPDKTSEFLKTMAIKHNIYLVGGSIPEKDDDKIYNTSYIFNPNGELIGKHRKAHLFDIDIEGGIRFMESEVLSPGNKATLIDVCGVKLGVMICYDIRFPEFSRKLALMGAQAIVVPAAFNMTTGPAHWSLSARARALDNQVYMLLCSQSRSTKTSYTAYGHSLCVNPWGKIEKELDEKEGILTSEIDTQYIKKVRRELPLLRHSRDELYR